jgi:UDP-N-acetylmuramate--alanine ligase
MGTPVHVMLPESLAGLRIHLVGIKGTGMAALAEVLAARGAVVSGSDTGETFYTDAILRRLGIPFTEGFAAANLPAGAALVVHSAAYQPDENPELLAAAAARIPIATYPEALGLLSGRADSSGVCGVHGKSTTTALCGLLLKAWSFPATVIVGAEVPAFGGRSTLVAGDRYLVAETCEYRRHFLNFHPERILITSIEPDHLDYFKDLEDILDAFEVYGRSLPFQGAVVYCADDAGASEAARRIFKRRDDLRMIPYGRSAEGAFRITALQAGEGRTSFRLAGFPIGLSLRVPGEHLAMNATGALALCAEIWRAERGAEPPDIAAASQAFASFTGARRRSEIVGEARGVLVMDDYAHHPTAIAKTLAGIKAFYPGRRLVVSFMSHTYSRTRALLAEFATAFGSADEVLIHRIYGSAREQGAGSITGEDLGREVAKHHGRVRYVAEPLDAAGLLVGELASGDILVTMGAGDNWKLGREVLARLENSA